MRLAKIILILGAILLMPIAHGNDNATALSGFITGNIYKEFSYSEQRGYIIGYFDGLLASPLLHRSNVESDDLESCIRKMTDTQLLAMVDKYMTENPDKWHMPMNILMWSMIQDTCGL